MSFVLLKTLIRTLILPPSGPLLLGFLGFALLRRFASAGRLLVGLCLVSLWALSTPVIADCMAGWVETCPPLDLRMATGAQAIVILGGGGQLEYAPEYAGPVAQPLLLERLNYGAYVARKTGLPVLVSGAPIEAAAMQATLERNFELPVRWVENKSGDTFENARNSVLLLKHEDIDRIVLVTHAAHMARSVKEFVAAGVQVVAAPTGFVSKHEHRSLGEFLPSPSGLQHGSMALYELIGEQAREFMAFTHLRRH